MGFYLESPLVVCILFSYETEDILLRDLEDWMFLSICLDLEVLMPELASLSAEVDFINKIKLLTG